MTTGSGGADAELLRPARLRALEVVGLRAEVDERMDEFAEWVRIDLRVPVALVSIVRPDSQVFPGMAGLPEPWASRRSTPLTHSFCQHVVLTAEPLAITDAREHPRIRHNLAIDDLGVVAYAGMPLTDGDGNVLGSLCAIDTTARRWTSAEIDTLGRIARACSTEIRLRLARYDRGVEEVRRDTVEFDQQRSFERSQTLLAASQAFSATATRADVLDRIRDLVRSELHPTVVVTVLVEGGRLHRIGDLGEPALSEWFDRDAGTPAAAAIRLGRLIHHADRADVDASYPPETRAEFRHLGLHSLVAVPLPERDALAGAIVLGWDRPNPLEPADLLVLASIAGYAGQAFVRADVLGHRIAVAHEMQDAMLTALPTFPGLEMAARYEPADARENVGGDWYDAVPVGKAVAVSVGDVIGHSLDAVSIMGQVRSMLRQSTWDHPGAPPSAILSAFESANTELALGAAGTAVLAHLRRLAGRWSVTWTNAGHPPPILMPPHGPAVLLAEHDALFGFAATARLPRTDHHAVLEPGTTLFLYTDGLIERRGVDLDTGTSALVDLLTGLRDRPVGEVVDGAVDALAAGAPDDVVAFAIRFR